MLKKISLSLVTVGFVSVASAADVDYATTLNSNLTTINSIWGTVATIMIASALVAVGVKFFRKAQ